VIAVFCLLVELIFVIEGLDEGKTIFRLLALFNFVWMNFPCVNFSCQRTNLCFIISPTESQ